MVPFKESLERLAEAYMVYLINRDESAIKGHLSLNFMIRQKVTDQLRLIKQLPKLLYGIGIEVNLLDQYDTALTGNSLVISPLQFDVCYSPHANLIEIEKITITINGAILEKDEWKIESIISDDERFILLNAIENLKEYAQM